MPISMKPLPVLALMAWALPLAAQEATEAPAEPPPAEEPAAPPAEGQAPAADGELPAPEGLSMGEAPAEAASGEPRVGQPYIREEFGDWALRCLRTETGEDPCQLYQLLMDAEGNPVAEFSIFPLPPGTQAVAGAEIVAPLLTLLTENVTLSVDGANSREYPFTYCNQAGCVARVGFTAEEVEQFRRGNAGQLTIVPALAPDEQVTLDISLSGFTAGYGTTEEALAASIAAQEAAPAEAPAE